MAWPPTAGTRAWRSQSRFSSLSMAPTSALRLSRTSSASGTCSRTTATLPSLMIPAFSVATSATVDPSSGWSRPMGHTTATSPAIRLVASHVPPMPTSNTASCTGLSANHKKPSAVSVSKYVARPTRPSIVSRTGNRCSYSSANSLSESGSPQIWIRSVTDRRCGDVNKPVTSPCAHASAETSRAVVVLPFVPVTWIVGYVRCGSSRSSAIARIRSRSGFGMCSGCRASRSATASANRTRSAVRRESDVDGRLGGLDVVERRDVPRLTHVAFHSTDQLQPSRAVADDDALHFGSQRALRQCLRLANLAEHPCRHVVDDAVTAGRCLGELAGRRPRRPVDRPRTPPRPDLFGHVRQHRREQPKQHVERETERRDGRAGGLVPVRPVRAALHELDVVVGEPPEEPLGDVERPLMLVLLERLGGLVDDLRQSLQHRAVEGVGDRTAFGLEPQGEPRGVQDFDGEPSAHADLAFLVRRVDAEASARRPVPNGVSAVPLEHFDRRDHVAFGL